MLKYVLLVLAVIVGIFLCNHLFKGASTKISSHDKKAIKLDYVIRKGTLEDIGNIKQLYQRVAAIPGGLARTEAEITDEYINELVTNGNNNGLILVVEYQGNLIGVMSKYKLKPQVFSHVLASGSIVVDPQFQGKGIGSHLITTFLDEIKEHHADILRVELMARESNPAIKLYEKMGFKKEGRFEKRVRSQNGGLEADIPLVWFNPNFRLST